MKTEEKLKRIYDYYVKECKKCGGLDPQAWDWKAHMDTSLTLVELRAIIQEYIDKNTTVTQKAK